MNAHKIKSHRAEGLGKLEDYLFEENSMANFGEN